MSRPEHRGIRSLRSVATIASIMILGSCVVNFHLVARLDRHIAERAAITTANSNDGPASLLRKSAARRDGGYDHTKRRETSEDAVDGSARNETATSGRERVVDAFRDAGVELDADSLKRLPTWEQIESAIGPAPTMIGLDRCHEFREAVPPLRRMLGSAGMFNSGTNLLTQLMKWNCRIPERYEEAGPLASRDSWGIRWQCPWGKHTPVRFKYNHTAPENENVPKDDCLPIVTVRNPFDWMRAMCKNPYTLRWGLDGEGRNSRTICPNLVDERGDPQTLIAKLTGTWMYYDSLAHLWNEWYAQYWKEASFPFLMVRLEDLVLRQYETTKTLCECAGGETPQRGKFEYIVDSAKVGPGHGNEEDRTGMVDAWMKFGKSPDVKAGFRQEDWEASLKFLDRDLMEKLGYDFPPSQ